MANCVGKKRKNPTNCYLFGHVLLWITIYFVSTSFYFNGDAPWKYGIHTHPTQIDRLLPTVAIRTTIGLFAQQLEREDEHVNVLTRKFLVAMFQTQHARDEDGEDHN